jgi:hypothetical protein
MLHRGLTLQQAAAAVAALITAANAGDENFEVFPRWSKALLKDDETQNAARDKKSFKLNRWYVLPFNRSTRRMTDVRNCETPMSAERKQSPILAVRFLYSYRKSEAEAASPDEPEKPDAYGKYSDDYFWERFERTADYLSVHPFLDEKRTAYHTELQLDKTDLVYFRRELCLEATARLGIEYADYVKET